MTFNSNPFLLILWTLPQPEDIFKLVKITPWLSFLSIEVKELNKL